MSYPTTQLRRLRYNSVLRRMLSENHISVDDCILPLFIRHGDNSYPIKSMPGHSQLSLKDLASEIDEILELGISAVILFGIPAEKDADGALACLDESIVQQAVRLIKKQAPQLLVVADLCFCEYTTHGHCGVLNEKQDVDNAKTLTMLAKQAISLARSGADVIAPSGMMDGMVKVIRDALDQHDFSSIPILSYAVKYASALYGPFREAAEGAPQFGNRETYQMNPANVLESLREAEQDIAEGADLLMVKPAGAYLDVIAKIKQAFPSIPLCAYQVSGEFAMIKAASEKGWLDEKKVMLESLIAIKRAGADLVITYFAKELALLQSVDSAERL